MHCLPNEYRQLNVLHDRRNERIASVSDCIRLHLDGILKKLIDQDGTTRCNIHSRVDKGRQHVIVIDDFHPPAAQHIRGSDHERVADLMGHGKRLLKGRRGAALRLRNPESLITFLKRFRSSARSMLSGDVPRIFTPASSSSCARLRGVCPPN